MRRVGVSLRDEQLEALRYLAAARKRCVSGIVREAVDEYLKDDPAIDVVWRTKFARFVEQVQSRIPSSITPEETEADISRAREEVRQMHRALRRA